MTNLDKLSSFVIIESPFRGRLISSLHHKDLEKLSKSLNATGWASRRYLDLWYKKHTKKHRKLIRHDDLAVDRSEFKERDTILKALGYPSFRCYLKSRFWDGIRREVLARDNHSCMACNRKASRAHHTEFSRATLSGEILDSIVSVCSRCRTNIARCTKSS